MIIEPDRGAMYLLRRVMGSIQIQLLSIPWSISSPSGPPLPVRLALGRGRVWGERGERGV